MSSAYVYRKPVKRSRYAEFRRRLIMIFIVLASFGAVGLYIYLGIHNQKTAQPISAVTTTVVNGNKQTFTNDYFSFMDSGTWVIDKNDSNAKQIVYHKFNKNVQMAEMIFYINSVPIPLYLYTPRVLPIRLVNDNTMQATAVSNPCGTTYAAGEPHKVKEVSIQGTTMLCDPDSPEYYVSLAEVGGDYRLNFKRPNGVPIQFVVTYKDTALDPRPDALLNVVNSFKVH